MTAFDIDIKGRKRDELSRTEWLKLTNRINKLQPAIFSFKAGVISHRIDRPTERVEAYANILEGQYHTY
jgi:hypothetical protein